MEKKKKRFNVEPQGSKEKGVAGLFETILRKLSTVAHAILLIPMYAFASFSAGIALMPGIALFNWVHENTHNSGTVFRYGAMGVSIGSGYFLYGFSLLIILPTLNFIMRANLKPWRGTYYSLGTVNWYIHNSMTYLMRYTFLEFLTPTPFNIIFYQLMGMKVGRGTQINSSHITDPSLIELGKKVTIGGSATICAHYGMSGFLIIAPVKIGDGAVIGLRAIIMGGVTIGENAKVLPNSVVLPKTVIPAGETWAGVPAKKIDLAAEQKTA